MKNYPLFLLLFISISFFNCAKSHYRIDPPKLAYIAQDKNDKLTLEYKYDVLQGSNRKREREKGLRLVALKITNTSNRDLLFGHDFDICFENGQAIDIFHHQQAYRIYKKAVLPYMLHLAWTPLKLYILGSKPISIGYVLGPVLAIVNTVKASRANQDLLTEMKYFRIDKHRINKGKTKYGLINIVTPVNRRLKIKMK